MKIVIFGSGGVGGYFGGRLAQSWQDVTLLARGAHLDAIREKGLRVDSVDGDFIVYPAKATDDPASIGEADLILLAVKAWQLNNALPQSKPLIGERTMILPLMNGMEHMELLFSTFGEKHILGGLSRISTYIEAPGHIRHVGIAPYLAFGEWNQPKAGEFKISSNCSNRSKVSLLIIDPIFRLRCGKSSSSFPPPAGLAHIRACPSVFAPMLRLAPYCKTRSTKPLLLPAHRVSILPDLHRNDHAAHRNYRPACHPVHAKRHDGGPSFRT